MHGMGWDSDSLYDKTVNDWFDDYDRGQIKDRLLPYMGYIKDIMKHYREHPLAVIECKPCGSSESPQDKLYDGVWLDLRRAAVNEKTDQDPKESTSQHRSKPPESVDIDLAPEILQHIMDADKTQYVWEYGREKNRKIEIVDRDQKRMRIRLERKPGTEKVQILHNTYSLYRQKEAIGSLLYRPEPKHKTLIKLFHDRNKVNLGKVKRKKIKKWFLLTDDRDGSDLQREFVEKALGTPDFAFLEGPPGSGKTTVLCELVLQLISCRKRVLFCASTHVAVDNLFERLAGTDAATESNLIPLRIGDSEKIAGAIDGYMYKNVIKTWKKQISKRLSGIPNPNEAQKSLIEVLKYDDTIGQIARDCSNLVCGTTIGILQHPDIRDSEFYGMFDVMIMDEASKTTFQEFLVPAMHAGRWIIAGDTKQLAPHTEQTEIGLHLDRCVDKRLGQVCVDVFDVSRRRYLGIISAADHDLKEMYQMQCEKLKVRFVDADDNKGWYEKVSGISKGMIVAGSARSLSNAGAKKLAHIANNRNITVKNAEMVCAVIEKQTPNTKSLKLFRTTTKRMCEDQNADAWGPAVGWRAGALPLGGRDLTVGEKKIQQDIECLMPADDTYCTDAKTNLETTRSIALPSILQLLQYGHKTGGEETVMAKGIPKKNFGSRHVLLEYQYRMHPDIAAFAEKYVYEGVALKTPQIVKQWREWGYGRYDSRLAWINMPGNRYGYANKKEAKKIAQEIGMFCRWARKNPRQDGKPWEIAVLAFYTRQVDAIRPYLARLTRDNGFHTFRMPSEKQTPDVTINLRTLDAFQGHEADMVFLSIVRSRPTVFLENPNRINVAVTRARYQQVIVGDRGGMYKSDSLLGKLAKDADVSEAGNG